MTVSLSTVTDTLLEAARKAGADHADALAVDGTSVQIDVLDGKLEQAERAEGIEIGLRVMIGQRQACVSASDISTSTIQTMAERAVAMAKEAPEDPWIGLADPSQLATDVDIQSLQLADPADEVPAQTLQELALRAEISARNVAGVDKVQASAAGYSHRRIALATSGGFFGGYDRTGTSVSCVAISGSGTNMERDYDGDSRTFYSDLRDPEDIGRTAGNRAVERAGSRKPPTGAFPVLYDERISSGLIGHMLAAINGSAIVRGGSWLRNAMGQQVLPDFMSVIESPHRPRISGSRPFDGEGLRTADRTIVENGVLTGWTLDLASARQLGMDSTANASRGPSSPPSPSVGNIAITQGTKSRSELLADMGTGLLVTSMIGTSINPNTGDYSRGASGFWVENGEIQYPVNECTVAGNLNDILKTLTPANDARQHLSRVIPSLLVEGLILAGA
ncbi:MAG: TldD/PmbA family protein [Pseudoruegeria sp.]